MIIFVDTNFRGISTSINYFYFFFLDFECRNLAGTSEISLSIYLSIYIFSAFRFTTFFFGSEMSEIIGNGRSSSSDVGFYEKSGELIRQQKIKAKIGENF